MAAQVRNRSAEMVEALYNMNRVSIVTCQFMIVDCKLGLNSSKLNIQRVVSLITLLIFILF